MNLLDLANQAKKKAEEAWNSSKPYNVFANVPQLAQNAGQAIQQYQNSDSNIFKRLGENTLPLPDQVKPVSQFVGNFTNNNVVNPILNAGKAVSQAVTKPSVGNTVNAGISALNASVPGVAYNTTINPLIRSATAGIQGIRTNQNPLKSAYRGLEGSKQIGLGDALTDNKMLAQIGNLAEIPLNIAGSKGVSALKQTPQVQRLIGAKTPMHPEDMQFLYTAMDNIKSKDPKLVQQGKNTLYNLAERYLDDKQLQKSNDNAQKLFGELTKYAESKPNVLGNFRMNLYAGKNAKGYKLSGKQPDFPMEGGSAPGQYILRQGQKNVSVMASPTTKNKLKLKDAKAQEAQAKAEFTEWNKSLKKQEGVRTTTGAINDLTRAIKTNTISPNAKSPETLKDISGFKAQARDVYRNFKEVYGERFPEVKRELLDPFDQAKGTFVDDQRNLLKELDDTIVTGMNIKKGSKESAAIQQFGEGKRDTNSLIAEFGQKRATDIINADKFFRNKYDTLLDQVNQVRAKIYPNNADKIIPKRSDYYRHFREMQDGFQGLKNIFETPSGIKSSLSGISPDTKPKSKFLSFAQKRLGEKTDEDAVGGFLDYTRAWSYAKNIDPQIGKFRALADEIAGQTAEGPNAGKLNNFVEYLTDFSNDLSGKTNPADRFVQKIVPGGRTAMRALTWLNNRIKANTIVGNASSMVAQVFNIPQGIAEAGPVNSSKALGRTMLEVLNEQSPGRQSNFLKERYSGSMYNKFDTGYLSNVKNFAGWITGVWDEGATKYIWNAQYEKALSQSIPNPVKHADDVTRSLIAGRGIGETPLLQNSKLTQLVAPFQLEVGNLWWVMKDNVDQKQFGKIASLFVLNYLMNRGAEAIRGSDVTFDPIQAMIEAGQTFNEEDDKVLGAMKATGRVAGEFISNIPGTQSAAALYPEYGFKVNDAQFPTRSEFFGKGDPTRFGTGTLVEKGLQDPLFKVLPSFGGGQLKKTIQGIQDYTKGYTETKSGQVKFPIDQNTNNAVKSTIFGSNATSNAQEYFKNKSKPLGKNQSEEFKSGGGKDVYNEVMSNRTESRETSGSEPKEDNRSFLQKLFNIDASVEDASAAEDQAIDQFVDTNSEGLTPLEKEKLKKDITNKQREYRRILRDKNLTDDQKNSKLTVIDNQIKALQKSDNKKKEPKRSYLDVGLTGDKSTDKAIIAKQIGNLTTEKNGVLELLDSGDITQQEAISRVAEIDQRIKDVRGKSSGGSRKLKISASSKPKIKMISSPKRVAIQGIKTPQTQGISIKSPGIKLSAPQRKISIKKPKIKKLSLKKS